MKSKNAKKIYVLIVAALAALLLLYAYRADSPVEVKALILPKFEVSEMAGDFPGEAQYYYEAWCQGGEEYDIYGGAEGSKLYVKDGIALYVTGMGKVNAALSVENVLQDDRFDFSNALILSTGCAGSAVEYGVMGDVYVISATVDYDLGYHTDSRDLQDADQPTTWYYDADYDSSSHRILNQDLIDQVYDLVKDTKVETTERTRNYMSAAFDGAAWAVRDPKVLRGTSVTADEYWKGETCHNNALLVTETYECPDPFAASEMEDNAVAVAVDRLGLLDHLVILRDSVNMDVFMNGATPESLWDPDFENELASEDSIESADIFATAMKNNFDVGNIVIEAYLDGTLTIE